MIDTLNTVVKIVEKSNDNGIELINKIDSFYNSAWDKLILVGSVAFGVIGIIVPLIIQWYQKKTLNISEEILKKEIENRTLKLKSELLIDINKTLEERIKIFEDKLEKSYASSNAKAFQLQGNVRLESGFFSEALSDYIVSAQDYLFCEDYYNLPTVLQIILNDCLPKLTIEEIDDLKISHNCDLILLLEKLELKEDKGTFSKMIREIRLKLAKLPKTLKDKPQSSK